MAVLVVIIYNKWTIVAEVKMLSKTVLGEILKDIGLQAEITVNVKLFSECEICLSVDNGSLKSEASAWVLMETERYSLAMKQKTAKKVRKL